MITTFDGYKKLNGINLNVLLDAGGTSPFSKKYSGFNNTDSNSKWILIGQLTLSSRWVNKSVVLSVSSRHNGNGIYVIHYGAEVSNEYYGDSRDTYFDFDKCYCNIVYYGDDTDLAGNDKYIICYVKPISNGTNNTSATFSFFYGRHDLSDLYITVLSKLPESFELLEPNSSTEYSFGSTNATLYNNIPSGTYGLLKAITKFGLHTGNTRIENGNVYINNVLLDLGLYVKKTGTTYASPITGPLWIKNTDALRLHSNNLNVRIWSIEGNDFANDDTYGFHLLYKGTGNGNDNDLQLYAHNQAGTKQLVYTVKQDGKTIYSTNLEAPKFIKTGSSNLRVLLGDGSDKPLSDFLQSGYIPSTIKTVTRETNATHYLVFVDSNNSTASEESLYTDAGITYNPSLNYLGIGTNSPGCNLDVNGISRFANSSNFYGVLNVRNGGYPGDNQISYASVSGELTSISSGKYHYKSFVQDVWSTLFYFMPRMRYTHLTDGDINSTITATDYLKRSYFQFRQYSPTETVTNGNVTSYSKSNYYESFSLPVVDSNRTTNVYYDILTSKNKVTIAQGGTNNNSFTTNLLISYDGTKLISSGLTPSDITSIPKFAILVVSSLPTSNISKTTIYLVKRASGNFDNDELFTEWIRITDNGVDKWESLGTVKVPVNTLISKNRAQIDTLTGVNNSTDVIDANNFTTFGNAYFELRGSNERNWNNIPTEGANNTKVGVVGFLNLYSADNIVATQIITRHNDIWFRSKLSGNSTITTDWHKVLHSENYTLFINSTNFPGLSGVRSVTINENYLRVNTDGTNTDLTIPFATYAKYLKPTITIDGADRNNYPWRRLAYTEEIESNYVDKSAILLIYLNFKGGRYGILKIALRTNNLSNNTSTNVPHGEAIWLSHSGYTLADVKVGTYWSTSKCYADVFINTLGTYPRTFAIVLLNKGWSFYNSNETSYANGDTPTNAYINIDGSTTSYASKAIHNLNNYSFVDNSTCLTDPVIVNSNPELKWNTTHTIGSVNGSNLLFKMVDNEGTSDFTDGTELLSSYASNNGFNSSGVVGKIYRRKASSMYNYINDKLKVIPSTISVNKNNKYIKFLKFKRSSERGFLILDISVQGNRGYRSGRFLIQWGWTANESYTSYTQLPKIERVNCLYWNASAWSWLYSDTPSTALDYEHYQELLNAQTSNPTGYLHVLRTNDAVAYPNTNTYFTFELVWEFTDPGGRYFNALVVDYSSGTVVTPIDIQGSETAFTPTFGTTSYTSHGTNDGLLEYVSSEGETHYGNLYVNNTTNNSIDIPAKLEFNLRNTTSGSEAGNRAYISVYDSRTHLTSNTTNNGSNMVINSTSNMVIGGGNTAELMYSNWVTSNRNAQITTILAGTDIQLFANASTITNRIGTILNLYTDSSLVKHPRLLPANSDGLANNIGYIGTSSNKWRGIYATDFNGTYFYASNGFYVSSDIRLKDVLSREKYTVEQFATLPLIKFIWNNKNDNIKHLGTIALDVEFDFPELITENSDGYKSLDYATLGTIGVISLARELVELKKEVKQLKLKLYG